MSSGAILAEYPLLSHRPSAETSSSIAAWLVRVFTAEPIAQHRSLSGPRGIDAQVQLRIHVHDTFIGDMLVEHTNRGDTSSHCGGGQTHWCDVKQMDVSHNWFLSKIFVFSVGGSLDSVYCVTRTGTILVDSLNTVGNGGSGYLLRVWSPFARIQMHHCVRMLDFFRWVWEQRVGISVGASTLNGVVLKRFAVHQEPCWDGLQRCRIVVDSSIWAILLRDRWCSINMSYFTPHCSSTPLVLKISVNTRKWEHTVLLDWGRIWIWTFWFSCWPFEGDHQDLFIENCIRVLLEKDLIRAAIWLSFEHHSETSKETADFQGCVQCEVIAQVRWLLELMRKTISGTSFA